MLTQEVRQLNRLPFYQGLQGFSKRINGQAVHWKAKSREEHSWALAIGAVINREMQVTKVRAGKPVAVDTTVGRD